MDDVGPKQGIGQGLAASAMCPECKSPLVVIIRDLQGAFSVENCPNCIRNCPKPEVNIIKFDHPALEWPQK